MVTFLGIRDDQNRDHRSAHAYKEEAVPQAKPRHVNPASNNGSDVGFTATYL